jgi:hypothetical protein
LTRRWCCGRVLTQRPRERDMSAMTAVEFQRDATGRTNRWVGRCHGCGLRLVEHRETTRGGRNDVAVCVCGGRVALVHVYGFAAGRRCDVRCVNAKRADCECECAGENHGTAA